MMTRRLVFDGAKAEKRFQFCRQALLGAGGSLTQAPGQNGPGRTKDTVRQEARLLDALDSISIEAPVEEDADRRTLTPGDAVMQMELGQHDHALLTRYVESMPWLPRVAREAVDVMDWLSAAEKIEV